MTNELLDLFTRAGSECVVWALAALAVASAAVIVERAFWFRRGGRSRSPTVIPLLAWGRLEQARLEVEDQVGLEADVVRAALDAAGDGAASVTETVAWAVRREREGYERGLGFLGTVGSIAPFLGLFGTAVGVIRAEAGVGVGNAAGAHAVTSGVPGALVATAVGILVAILAVAAFETYRRRLEGMVTRAEALGHALASWLARDEVRSAAIRQARPTAPRRAVKAVDAA